MIPSPDVDREIVRRGGFYAFLQLAWPQIGGLGAFVPNWHLEESCEFWEAVSRRDVKRFVKNVPPGTGKTLTSGVFFNAWEWGPNKHPETKFIYASYDQGLMYKAARQLIDLLQGEWFIKRWGRILDHANPAVGEFFTKAGGWRFSTSVRGKLTGRHGDIGIIDDPIKPLDAARGFKGDQLQMVNDWVGNTWTTRFRDQLTCTWGTVMQRLHANDLAGFLLERQATHFCLPMRYDAETASVHDRRTEPGELLFPQRFPEIVVRALEIDLDSAAPAQLQQNTTAQGGNLFKKEHFQIWTKQTLPPEGLEIQSWDFTFAKTESSDNVSGGVYRMYRGLIYKLYWINKRMTFTESLAAIAKVSILFPRAFTKLIEAKANGHAIENFAKAQIQGLTLLDPEGSKLSRAHAITPTLGAGRYFIPDSSMPGYEWSYSDVPRAKDETYRKIMLDYPKGKTDDAVDETTQAIRALEKFGTSFEDAMRALRENWGVRERNA